MGGIYKKNEGFTLIELMIVIAILGILVTLISGNFLTSLKKGNDARRKSDIHQTQQALEIYYEDNNKYPDSSEISGTQLCHPGSGACTTKIYMQKIPKDPKTNQPYIYETDAGQTWFKMYSCLENELDEGEGVNQNGWKDQGGFKLLCGSCGDCKFKVESANAPQ